MRGERERGKGEEKERGERKRGKGKVEGVGREGRERWKGKGEGQRRGRREICWKWGLRRIKYEREKKNRHRKIDI